MTIRRVTVRTIEEAMEGGLYNPRMRWTHKQIVLVFLEDSAGRIGVGEAWTSGASPLALEAIINDDLAPLVIGAECFEVPRLADQVFKSTELSARSGIIAAAWSAIDCAMHDLWARSLDLPLYQLLGQAQKAIPAYASAGLYGAGKSVGDLAAEVRGYVERGFRGVKIKVGGLPLKDDLARIAAVREAVGPDIELMIDALYNLDVAQALALARAAEPYDIHFLEAPVSPYDVEGQAVVADKSPMPICGNEHQCWAVNFKRLIEARAIHFVQFDIALCGGIREGRRIADLATLHHLPVTLHASSTSILFATSLHFALSCLNAVSIEYHMVHQWLWDRAPNNAFAIEDGCIGPPLGNGIGIELTPDNIRH
ncbi:MAG: mandelate racemase/muconate lactonizing enzyme family protein [Pseudomonadota bacterium]